MSLLTDNADDTEVCGSQNWGSQLSTANSHDLKLREQEHSLKQAIADRFGRAAHCYDAKAQVQKQVSARALTLLRETLLPESTVTHALDIGCGTGIDTVKLQQFAISVTGVDLSAGMITYAADKYKETDVNWLQGDAEKLPVTDHSVDLVYSSMALQWLSSSTKVAEECHRIMRAGTGGVIAVVVDGSLKELSNSWHGIGVNPPVNQFLPSELWREGFIRAGFNTRVVNETFYTKHNNILQLLHSLKDVGAGLVLNQGTNVNISKTTLQQLEKVYRDNFAEGPELLLSWRIAFIQFNK